MNFEENWYYLQLIGFKKLDGNCYAGNRRARKHQDNQYVEINVKELFSDTRGWYHEPKQKSKEIPILSIAQVKTKLAERISEIEETFVNQKSFGTWFDVILGQTENPYSYSRIGVFDPYKARESKARRQLSHELNICAYCLKQKSKRNVICCSKECEENFSHEFAFWIKSWYSLRAQCFKRDSYKCVKCGKEATDCDHIIEIIDGGDEWDLDNLQSLCNECHKEKTRKSWRERRKKTMPKEVNWKSQENYCHSEFFQLIEEQTTLA